MLLARVEQERDCSARIPIADVAVRATAASTVQELHTARADWRMSDRQGSLKREIERTRVGTHSVGDQLLVLPLARRNGVRRHAARIRHRAGVRIFRRALRHDASPGLVRFTLPFSVVDRDGRELT